VNNPLRFAAVVAACLATHFILVACTAATADIEPGAPGPASVAAARADEWSRSGARLRVRFVSGADGSREFLGWFDSQARRNCTFAPSLGALYCVPEHGTAGRYWGQACSLPLAQVNDGVDLIVAEDGFFAAGELYEEPVYERSPETGKCVSVADPPRVRRFGESVPASTYVRGEELIELVAP
jgi:hypothetical protein